MALREPPVRNTRRSRLELRRLSYDDLITVEEVALLLGVCTRTVYRHVQAGFIPPPRSVHLGGILLNRWRVGPIRALTE